MNLLRTLTWLTIAATALPAVPAVAQAPTKTLLQQASPIVDTLAARLAKLVREVEAAGADMPKVRGLTDKYKADNERMETQLADIKKQMTPAETGELEVYTQLKTGRLPEKLKAAIDKATKEAAEAAAKVGPATVAKYRETIAKYADEGQALIKRLRDAGADAGKREQAWQAVLAWDAKRVALLRQIPNDANVVEPKVLTDEAEKAHYHFAVHASRLYRLGAQPLSAELVKELKAAEGRVAHVAELAAAADGLTGGKAEMARAHVLEARDAAMEAIGTELTLDEAAEVRDVLAEALAPYARRVKGK